MKPYQKPWWPMALLIGCLVGTVLANPAIAPADPGRAPKDHFDTEDMGEPAFFDDEETDPQEASATPPPAASRTGGGVAYLWRILGQQRRFTYRHELSYQLKNPERVVTNRSSFRLESSKLFADYFYLIVDGKLSIHAQNDHRSRVRDQRVLVKSNLREGYLRAGFDNTGFCVGKQIVVWGEADGAVVTDVISPRDNSDFVFMTLEESRIGQYLFLLDIYSDWGAWSFIVNPDPRFDLSPESGTEYHVDTFSPEGCHVMDETPDAGDTEFGFRWQRIFGKSDISMMAADLMANQAVAEYRDDGESGKTRVLKGCHRFQMLGTAANYSVGDFLWKGELAYKHNRWVQGGIMGEGGPAVIKKDTLDAALAVEYSPGDRYTIGLEVSNRRILDWEKRLAPAHEDDTKIMGFWDKDFLHQTLGLSSKLTVSCRDRFIHQELRCDYDVSDRWRATLCLAWVDVGDQDSNLWPLREKHRVTASIQYQL